MVKKISISEADFSIEELKAEIQRREKPRPLAIMNGQKMYAPSDYNKLLRYYDNHGIPKDFSPMEFNPDGSVKLAPPAEVCVNVGDFFSNRVFQKGKEFHIVLDTWTIKEQATGDVPLEMINEYVLKENGKEESGYEIYRGAVTREDFMKNYKDAFGVQDMLTILKIIDENSAKLNATETISLSKKEKQSDKVDLDKLATAGS